MMIVPDPAVTTSEYRYGFQGQEKDNEIKGGDGKSINFTFRMHDPRLGRFFAIDPLFKSYPWNTPYAFSENRVIDGTELEGAEWKTAHKWSETITDPAHIRHLKSQDVYKNGMTYEDAYRARVKALTAKYIKENIKEDCANFAFYPLVDFADYYKLPVHFEDFRAASPNKVIDNDSSEFKDTQSLKKELGKVYSATSFFSKYNKFLKSVNPRSIDEGTLLTWQYYTIWADEEERTYHVSTATNVTKNEIEVTQGSLDGSSGTPIETKTYEREDNGEVDAPMKIKNVQAKDWDFKEFDENGNKN